MNTLNPNGRPRYYDHLLREYPGMHSEPDNENGFRLFFNGDYEARREAFGLSDFVVAASNGPWLAMKPRPSVWRCGYAYPGTYGHECGAPAVCVAVKKSDLTRSGLFYSGRCAECRDATAGDDNRRILRFEPVNETAQVNEWK